ncbi:DUF3450 family protein [Ferrimonas senticii]|uniref:DUF3450 family protein n=1 Tax=Ferrimonas senticii TaxID=394566 RepID=UPI0003FEFB41|nr:DUF3450 family protein [Ferrimonas senticii]
MTRSVINASRLSLLLAGCWLAAASSAATTNTDTTVATTSANPQALQATLAKPIASAAELGRQAARWQQQQADLNSQQQQQLAQLYWTEYQIAKLERQVAEQQAQVSQLSTDIANIDAIRQHLDPNLEIWYAELERFVEADLPFAKEERARRLSFLRQALDDVNLNQAERFSRLLEALRIEIEQGYGSHSEQALIELAGEQRQMQLLRIGRLAWFAQSADGQHSGYFDRSNNQWQPLGSEHNAAISSAIAISQNQQAAALVPLLIPNTNANGSAQQ